MSAPTISLGSLRYRQKLFLGIFVALVQLVVVGFWIQSPLPRFNTTQSASAEVPQPTSSFVLNRINLLLTVDESIASLVESLTTLEFLPQRLPILLAGLLIALASASLGRLVLRAIITLEKMPILLAWSLYYGLGTTLLGTLVLGLGCLGWLQPTLFRCLFVLIGLLGFGSWLWDRWRRRLDRPPSEGTNQVDPSQGTSSGWFNWGLISLFSGVVILMALGAIQPTVEFDALAYHLQGPKEYYQAGQIRFLPHNVYTSMPSAVEMLHLAGMVLLDDWWSGGLVGQLLIAGFAPATAILIGYMVERCGGSGLGWFAAVLYLTTPWVYRLAVYPFVEGPLCYFHAAGILGVLLATSDPSHDQRGRSGWYRWAVAGLYAGGAMGCKYPGLVTAVIPIGVVALIQAIRVRSVGTLIGYGVGVAVAIGPWLLRNLIDTGNPVYPLAFDLFGGRYWTEDLDQKWWRVHGPREFSLPSLREGLLNVAGRSDWQSILFILLAPLALLKASKRRLVLGLLTYLLLIFASWYFLTHRLERFWIPLLPAFAILGGLGASWQSGRLWAFWRGVILVAATLFNLGLILTPLSGPVDWTADLQRLRREVPASVNPALTTMDRNLPPDAKPLLVGQAAVFYLNRDLVYNSVFNPEIIEVIAQGRSAGAIRAELHRLGVTHLYVDWSEIERHRKPGGYGFTDFVTQELFDRLVAAGVLGPPRPIDGRHILFEVRGKHN